MARRYGNLGYTKRAHKKRAQASSKAAKWDRFHFNTALKKGQCTLALEHLINYSRHGSRTFSERESARIGPGYSSTRTNWKMAARFAKVCLKKKARG